MQLESSNSSLGKEITNQSSRQEASISTRLDKFAIEIQRLKGDIDGLRVGVTTGQLPGVDPEKEGSVAKTLTDMTARLDALEETQSKIVAAIDKAIEPRKPDKKDKESQKDKKKKKSLSMTKIEDLRESFQKKRYKLISEGGAKLIESMHSKKEKQEATFILAESLFKSGQTREAALKFNEYLEGKPKEHIPLALLRMGDCFRDLGDTETAKIYYQELIKKHNSSDEAKQAKTKVGKL